MLCDNCKKNEATTMFQQTINDHTTIQHLCPECAAKLGINSIFNPSILNTDQLFTHLLGSTFQPKAFGEQKTCPGCNSTIAQISTAGKVGCSQCYATFNEELTPTIEKIHGKVSHIGKVSNVASAELKRKRKLNMLKKELEEAIHNQEFEKAATLRDQIQSFHNGGEQIDDK